MTRGSLLLVIFGLSVLLASVFLAAFLFTFSFLAFLAFSLSFFVVVTLLRKWEGNDRNKSVFQPRRQTNN